MLLSGFCVAHASKHDPNDASWGVNGVPSVQIFKVSATNAVWPNIAIGNLRNVSSQPLEDIVVTVGDHEGNATIICGTDSLKDTSLAPNYVWRWSDYSNTAKNYEVLGVTVNGQVLSKIAAP